MEEPMLLPEESFQTPGKAPAEEAGQRMHSLQPGCNPLSPGASAALALNLLNLAEEVIDDDAESWLVAPTPRESSFGSVADYMSQLRNPSVCSSVRSCATTSAAYSTGRTSAGPQSHMFSPGAPVGAGNARYHSPTATSASFSRSTPPRSAGAARTPNPLRASTSRIPRPGAPAAARASPSTLPPAPGSVTRSVGALTGRAGTPPSAAGNPRGFVGNSTPVRGIASQLATTPSPTAKRNTPASMRASEGLRARTEAARLRSPAAHGSSPLGKGAPPAQQADPALQQLQSPEQQSAARGARLPHRTPSYSGMRHQQASPGPAGGTPPPGSAGASSAAKRAPGSAGAAGRAGLPPAPRPHGEHRLSAGGSEGGHSANVSFTMPSSSLKQRQQLQQQQYRDQRRRSTKSSYGGSKTASMMVDCTAPGDIALEDKVVGEQLRAIGLGADPARLAGAGLGAVAAALTPLHDATLEKKIAAVVICHSLALDLVSQAVEQCKVGSRKAKRSTSSVKSPTAGFAKSPSAAGSIGSSKGAGKQGQAAAEGEGAGSVPGCRCCIM